MATNIDVASAEEIINYTFHTKNLLALALRAPGAFVPGAVQLQDGNRGLGQLGNSVLQTVVLDHWYASGKDRGMLHLCSRRQNDTDSLQVLCKRR